MAGKVRVYIATSLDGFIAGPHDELDWLPHPSPDAVLPPGALGFEAFLAEVGVMVMGRCTFDVVRAMSTDWFFWRDARLGGHPPAPGVGAGHRESGERLH